MEKFIILCLSALVASSIADNDVDQMNLVKGSDSPLDLDVSNQNEDSVDAFTGGSKLYTDNQDFHFNDNASVTTEIIDVEIIDTINSSRKFAAYEQHNDSSLTSEQPNTDQTDPSNGITDQQTVSDDFSQLTTDTDDNSTDQSNQSSESIAVTSADPTDQPPITNINIASTAITQQPTTTTPSTTPSTVTTTASTTDKPTHQTPQPVKAANENPEDSYRKNVIVWVSGFALCCLVILVLVLLYHARRSSPTDHLP